MARKILVRTTLASLALAALGASPQDQDGLQRNTALVRVHPKTDRIVETVDALAAEGKFSQAIATLTEAVEGHPNHLVPVSDEGLSRPVRYLGAAEYARRKIASWVASSEEARNSVSAHFDPLAAALFEGARAVGDRAALGELVERYPFSTFADDALMLRANLEFDAGEPGRAVETLERLSTWAPTDIPLAAIYAKLGQAYARAGRKEALTALIARAERDLGRVKISAGGRETVLPDLLREELAGAVPPPPGSSDPLGGWEMFSGSPDGIRVNEPVEPGPRVWSAPLDQTGFSEGDEGMHGPPRVAGVPPSYRPVHPAVSDGIVYLHTEYAVSAYNLFSSGAEPLWNHRLPPPAGDLMFDDRIVHTTTVADGRVYANLVTWLDEYETQHSFITVKFPFPKRALFCFDAYTGRVLWKMGGQRRSPQAQDNLSFSVAPTPFDGLLYVDAIRQDHQTDPFEHHVMCLDPTKPPGSRVVWSTFVASGGTEINLFGNSTRESIASPVTVTDEAVHVATNHGAVATLDRRSGRLRWVAKYQQLPVNPTRNVNVRRNPLEWCVNAPIVAAGQVIAAPTDSRHLYSFDLRDGRKLWERQRSGTVRHLYGVTGNRLVAAGTPADSRTEVPIEWYDLNRQGALAERYVFSAADARGAGRGLLAGDAVYFPTADGLYKVKTGGGKPVATLHRWSARADGGNLVAADGALVLASVSEVAAFFDRRDNEPAVREELAARPDDPALVYRSALRLLQAGKVEAASELLARAIELTALSERPAESRIGRAARKRLYSISIRSGREALARGQLPRAETAFRRARDSAPDPASAVDASLSLAETLAGRKEHVAAIEEYDRLIENSEAESRPYEAARSGIAAILHAAGRDAYQPWEAKASKLLDRAGGTPEGSLEPAKRYPNSLAAEKGILAAASAWQRLGRPEEAISACRRFLQNYPDSDRAAEAQVTLVRLLEKERLYSAAAGVLRRMLRTPDREVSEDGRVMRARDFVERRLARDEYKSAALAASPPVRVPMTRIGAYSDKEFPEGAPLRVEGPPFQRGADLLFMAYRGTVKGVDLRKGSETWRVPVEGQVRAAFSVDDALVVCSAREIVRINPATGSVDWRHVAGSVMNGFLASGSVLCYLSPSPADETVCQVATIDVSRGVPTWSKNYDGVGTPRLTVHGETVIVVTQDPYRLLGFELETGERTMNRPMTFASGEAKVLGLVGNLLVVESPGLAIEGYRLPNGDLNWRVETSDLAIKAVDLSPAGLVLITEHFTGQEPELMASLISLKSGKKERIRGRLELDDPLALRTEGDRLLAASVTREGRTKVRSLSLPTFDEIWEADVSDAIGQVGGAEFSGGYILVFGGRQNENGTYNYSAALVDREGRQAQALRGDGTYERPPGMTVSGGSVVFSVDNRVEAWK